jgi:hypothetical protein
MERRFWAQPWELESGGRNVLVLASVLVLPPSGGQLLLINKQSSIAPEPTEPNDTEKTIPKSREKAGKEGKDCAIRNLPNRDPTLFPSH